LIGKVYQTDPGNFLRITGQSQFTPEQHVMEKLRCNTCDAYFTAPLPEEVLKDGTDTQKYGYSARSLMAIYKYFAGLPFYHQGKDCCHPMTQQKPMLDSEPINNAKIIWCTICCH